MSKEIKHSFNSKEKKKKSEKLKIILINSKQKLVQEIKEQKQIQDQTKIVGKNSIKM